MEDQLKNSLEKELSKAQEQSYANLVEETKPPTPYFKNTAIAFFVGGVICLIGQVILEIIKAAGVPEEKGITLTLLLIIFLGALLTGLGIYDKIGKYAGAGSIVPISGFANSIAAPALEWKTEGFINGLAAKMFTLAGPVIVYGISGSILLGLIKYIWLMIKGA